MSQLIEVKVPDIGDFNDIPVIEVLVSAGDQVEADQSLITLESDKATMEVPSPANGVIKELKVELNATVSEGDLVAVLEAAETTAAEEPAEAAPASQQQETPQEEKVAEESPVETKAAPPPQPPVEEPAVASPPVSEVIAAPANDSGIPYASPSIRRYARELGVDLSRVKGSGDKGRITQDDVSAFVKSVMQGAAAPSQAATSAPASTGGLDLLPMPNVDFSKFGEVETQPLSRIKKISGANLHRNWVRIPHVTQNDEADITDMEAFRKAHADEAKAAGFKLTPLVFLIKATVAALRKFPQFNASLDASGENLVLKNYFHIGIAVDTPDGLVVPVIRDCERKGVMELAEELGEISQRAREKKLKPQEMQGGCFSISSLGGIGGTGFTPIINAPEVAILGVSRSKMQPMWNGSDFQPRLMLPLSLSYDHRVIDGAAAARFTRYLASRLEDLRRLTL